MKRLFSAALALCMLLSCVPISAAEGEDYVFTLLADGVTDAKVQLGDEVTITLLLSSADGTDVDLYSIQDYICFDYDYLEPVSGSIVTWPASQQGGIEQVIAASPIRFSVVPISAYNRVYMNRASDNRKVVPSGSVILSMRMKTLRKGTTTLYHDTPELFLKPGSLWDLGTEDCTVEIVERVEMVKLTLNANGGQMDKDISGTYESGTEVTLPDASREGFLFIGWRDQNGETWQSGDVLTVGEPTTLTAQWQEEDKPVSLTLNAAGGQIVGKNITGEYMPGDTVTLPDAERTGFVFGGWRDQNGKTYEAGDTLTVGEPLTLTAQWAEEDEKVTLGLNPGRGKLIGRDVSGDYMPGASVTLPGAELEGYTFDGWRDPSGKAYSAGDKLTVTQSVTLTAAWTKIEKHLRLTLDPGSGKIIGKDISGDYQTGDVVTLPGAERTGFIFGGWRDGNGDVHPAGEKLTITAPITMSAVWTREAQQVKLTLNAGSGTIVGNDISGNYKVGDTVTLPRAARDGYSFDGWRNQNDHKIYVGGGEMVLTQDTLMTAEWTLTGGGGGIVIPVDPTVKPTVEKGSHFNYIIGYPNGDFGPYDNITRAEVATIVYRILSPETRAGYQTTANSFPDVKEGSWYNVAVSTLARAGIVEGMPDGMFHPSKTITRAELATIISRFTNISGGKTTFPDSVNHWASSYIATAAENGWVLGYPDGTFKPNNEITRAETVTMINRLLDRNPETADDLLPDMITFNDVTDPNVWYYVQVQEAANNHEYQRESDNVHEKWTARVDDIVW